MCFVWGKQQTLIFLLNESPTGLKNGEAVLLLCVTNWNFNCYNYFNFSFQRITRRQAYFIHTSCSVPCRNVQPCKAPRLCTGRTAHGGSRGIALPCHDHGTRRVWGVSITPRPLFSPGKEPVPIVQEAGWAPGPVWTGAENLARTGIWSPDRPARSQSLYWLRYPAHSM